MLLASKGCLVKLYFSGQRKLLKRVPSQPKLNLQVGKIQMIFLCVEKGWVDRIKREKGRDKGGILSGRLKDK